MREAGLEMPGIVSVSTVMLYSFLNR